MAPLQILQWLDGNPSPRVSGGWSDDPHQELRKLRELDAVIEGDRELARPGTRVAEDTTGNKS